MKPHHVLFALCLLPTVALVGSQTATAEIFKTVDKDGNISYTDQAPESGEKVKLRNSNSLPAVEIPAKDAEEAEEDEEKLVIYRKLRILSPANDSAIEHGPGNFTVQAEVKPELGEGHKLRLYMDGEPYGKPIVGTSFSLTNVFRGTHTLQVEIVNAEGGSLKKSRETSVHVFRPSVLLPGFRG